VAMRVPLATICPSASVACIPDSVGGLTTRMNNRVPGAIQTPSPVAAGLTCRCPRCGKGRLFEGFLTLRPRCEACGLDYAFADAGDGPAVFVILFAGFIVVGLALVVEFAYQPPFWLHALLWGPLILLVTLGPLRPFKGVLIALQYHHDASEGRLDRKGRHS
jgi:uncharacterized protein (DUF983 family)